MRNGQTKMKKPYFMENKDWYYYDKNTESFLLTNKAPKKAIENFAKIYDTGDLLIEENNNEYMAYINQEIMKIKGDSFELELFEII